MDKLEAYPTLGHFDLERRRGGLASAVGGGDGHGGGAGADEDDRRAVALEAVGGDGDDAGVRRRERIGEFVVAEDGRDAGEAFDVGGVDGGAGEEREFAEAAGDTLPIFERQRFQWGPGRDTGRTATESKGDLVVELFVFGRADPIWRDTMKVTSSSSFNEEITDATIRKSMLDRAAMEIRRLNFPYFIPESEEMVALPIVVQ